MMTAPDLILAVFLRLAEPKFTLVEDLAAIVPGRTKRERILERLARGENVPEIAIAEDTERGYIYNIRLKQRRERAVFENTRPIAPAAQVATVPLEPTTHATPPVAPLAVMGAPIEIAPEDPEMQHLKLHIAATRNNITEIGTRTRLMRQDLEEIVEEGRLRDDLVEVQLRHAIADKCPDFHRMFADRKLHFESMLTFLSSVEPFRTRLREIIEINVIRGRWTVDQTRAMVEACVDQFFSLFDEPDSESKTPLRDHVTKFLEGLLNPARGYCSLDRSPILPLGPVGVCALNHIFP